MKWIRALAPAAFVLACATVSAIPPTPELQSARTAYQSAAANAAVREKAAPQLAEAERVLQRAEAALGSGADAREIALLSHLAERRVLRARSVAGADPADAISSRAATAPQGPEREKELTELRAKALDVEAGARGTVVTLSRSLFDGSEPKPLAQLMLDRVAEFLASHPGRRVSVEGYTDNMGGAGYNERVSTERAQAVARYLQGRGVAPGRLSASGFGDRQPLASNSSPAGRRLNRRVEIVIENPAP